MLRQHSQRRVTKELPNIAKDHANTQSRKASASTGIFSLMVVTVGFAGGGMRLESLLLPILTVGLLAAFVRLTGTESFRRELRTLLLVLIILTAAYHWNLQGGYFLENDATRWINAARTIIAGRIINTKSSARVSENGHYYKKAWVTTPEPSRPTHY